MAEKSSFRRGNKRGMRFKPSGGLNRRPDRTGLKARANVETIETPQDEIYNTKQHESEIVRAENQAHGLPPDTDTDSAKAQRQLSNEENGNGGPKPKGRRSRGKKGQKGDGDFTPVDLPEDPAKSVSEKIQRTAKKFVSKVKGIFRPIQHSHKEILVNAESLETLSLIHI